MSIEKTRIKFQRCAETGAIIGLVSRKPTDQQLKGVDENSPYGKKVCVLSEDLKGTVEPGILYDVELKEMHNKKGFVVVSAIPRLFKAIIETTIVSKSTYRITVTFGHKVVYFDPKDGRSPSSRTLGGVLKILKGRKDIEDQEQVLDTFKATAYNLIERMEADGFVACRQGELFPL